MKEHPSPLNNHPIRETFCCWIKESMERRVCFGRMNGKILRPHFGGRILRMHHYLKHHRHFHRPQMTAPCPLWWTVTAPCWGATAPLLPSSTPCAAVTGSRTEICRNWTVPGHVGEMFDCHSSEPAQMVNFTWEFFPCLNPVFRGFAMHRRMSNHCHIKSQLQCQINTYEFLRM